MIRLQFIFAITTKQSDGIRKEQNYIQMRQMWLDWTSFSQSIRCYDKKKNARMKKRILSPKLHCIHGQSENRRMNSIEKAASPLHFSYYKLIFLFFFCFLFWNSLRPFFHLHIGNSNFIPIYTHALHKRIEHRALKQVCFASLEPLCHVYQTWVALENAIECGRNNCTAFDSQTMTHWTNFLQTLLNNNFNM